MKPTNTEGLPHNEWQSLETEKMNLRELKALASSSHVQIQLAENQSIEHLPETVQADILRQMIDAYMADI
jgi:hypothetical protein